MTYEKASPKRLAFFFATVTVFVTVVEESLPQQGSNASNPLPFRET